MNPKQLKEKLNKNATKVFDALGMKTEVFNKNILMLPYPRRGQP